MRGPRIARDLAEMVDQLDRQLRLLQEYSQQAFHDGREDLLPEVAAKLRILLVRSRHNTPLLLEVANRLKVTPTLVLDGPPLKRPAGQPGPGDQVTLDAFFDMQAVTIGTANGSVTMTKRELIRAWAEQLGGAHEDWAVDEALVKAVRFPLRIGGMQPTVMELHNCARVTLEHGRQVVLQGRNAKLS